MQVRINVFRSSHAAAGVFVILVSVQNASDLSSKSGSLQQATHAACIVEEFPSQFCRHGIPLHDQRCPEASQDILLFLGNGSAAGSILHRGPRRVLMIYLSAIAHFLRGCRNSVGAVEIRAFRSSRSMSRPIHRIRPLSRDIAWA
jgi:hypothetical protein